MSDVVYPPVEPAAPMPGDRKGLAIASLVIGIVNLCAWLVPICGGPLAIVGMLLGILGLKSSKKTLAIVGVVLGGLTLILTIVSIIVGTTMAPQLMEQLDLNQFMP